MNNQDIPLNVTNEIEFEVTKEYTASHIGSGSVSVLATPSMILFMEIASGRLVQKYLSDGFTSVGTKVCIDHLSAVFENKIVISKSKISEVKGNKVNFYVEVIYNNRLIGRGTHQRYIVNESAFLEKLRQK